MEVNRKQSMTGTTFFIQFILSLVATCKQRDGRNEDSLIPISIFASNRQHVNLKEFKRKNCTNKILFKSFICIRERKVSFG